MKQTAVEWLIEEIHKNIEFIPVPIQEQAKEMEKEQMILFYLKGCDDTYGYDEPVPFEGYDRKEAEKYYNETFKNKTK